MSAKVEELKFLATKEKGEVSALIEYQCIKMLVSQGFVRCLIIVSIVFLAYLCPN